MTETNQKAYADKVEEWSSRDHWIRDTRHTLDTAYPETSWIMAINIIDLGCGTGRFLKTVCMEYPSASIVVGVDPNISCLNKARSRTGNLPLFYEDLVMLTPDTFHLGFCIHAIPQMEYPEQTIAQLYAKMRTNGLFLVVVHNPAYEWVRAPWRWLRGYKGDRTIQRHYGEAALMKLLQGAGFSIDKIERFGGPPAGLFFNHPRILCVARKA